MNRTSFIQEDQMKKMQSQHLPWQGKFVLSTEKTDSPQSFLL